MNSPNYALPAVMMAGLRIEAGKAWTARNAKVK